MCCLVFRFMANRCICPWLRSRKPQVMFMLLSCSCLKEGQYEWSKTFCLLHVTLNLILLLHGSHSICLAGTITAVGSVTTTSTNLARRVFGVYEVSFRTCVFTPLWFELSLVRGCRLFFFINSHILLRA